MMNLSKRLTSFNTPKIFHLEKSIRSLVGLSKDNEHLEIHLENESEKFPLVWLRDNCTCEKCYHAASNSRIIDWTKFNVDVKAKTVTKTNNEVWITWQDGHQSKYTCDWLKSRSFTKHTQRHYLNMVYRPPKIPWDKEDFKKILHVYDYTEINTNNTLLYKWLMDLSTYGVVMIKNAPPDEKEAVNFANKIAFIRKTHYGEDYHIKNKPGTQNVAYLNSTLQLHTDLPYYDYKPGVNLLHCVVQTDSDGGDSLLTDVFSVVEHLKKTNKSVVDILTTTQINWVDVGQEDGVKFNKIHRSPMIRLDPCGNVECVRHSIPQRASHFTVDINDVKPWYEAFKIFVDTINERASVFRLNPGDILAFDNIRLVHGRSQYEDTDTSRRFLVGMFIDWDEVYSKLRVLQNELKF